MQPGFFCLLRYAPDIARGEFVNVGVALVVPGVGFASVKAVEDAGNVVERFGGAVVNRGRFSDLIRNFGTRVQMAATQWREPKDASAFASRLGNSFKLSEPHFVSCEDPASELRALFGELVHIDRTRRRTVKKPDLRTAFEPLMGVVRRARAIELPAYGTFKADYEYQNGTTNFVRGEAFAVTDAHVRAQANELACKGHLIDKEEIGHLIVVGRFFDGTSYETREFVSELLEQHASSFVPADELPAFVAKVRRDAHN